MMARNRTHSIDTGPRRSIPLVPRQQTRQAGWPQQSAHPTMLSWLSCLL